MGLWEIRIEFYGALRVRGIRYGGHGFSRRKQREFRGFSGPQTGVLILSNGRNMNRFEFQISAL